jgi:aminoglycoside phosphotransferase (APT) family kinase protein
MAMQDHDQGPEAGVLLRGAADHFGLGAVLSFERVPEGFSHAVYQLQTTEDLFAVKVLNTELSVGGTVESLLGAVEVESAAVAGGVAAPEPLSDGAGRYLAQIGGEHWVRVHRWISGRTRSSSRASDAEIVHIVESLVQLHALEIAPTVERDIAVPDEWDAHAVAAEHYGVAWASDLSAASAQLEIAGGWAAERPGPAELSSHRDVYPRNVLFAGRYANLVDWDLAGPTTRAEEVAVAAMEWSGGIVDSPDPHSLRAFVAEYTRLTGHVVVADRSLYGRWLTRQLRWLDYHLHLALGSSRTRDSAMASKRVGFLVPRLVRQLREVDSWLSAIDEVSG